MTATFVLMAGLPGTGKSTLATALAAAANGVVLSKDVVRAALFPGDLTDYSEEQDDLCFGALLDAAVYIATHHWIATHNLHPEHRYIFLDGRTFRKRTQIESAIRAAKEAGCAWRILLLTTPDDVAIFRIAADHRRGAHLAGNRDESMYLESKARFEPIGHACLRVDTTASLQDCVQLCLAYLASTPSDVHRP